MFVFDRPVRFADVDAARIVFFARCFFRFLPKKPTI